MVQQNPFALFCWIYLMICFSTILLLSTFSRVSSFPLGFTVKNRQSYSSNLYSTFPTSSQVILYIYITIFLPFGLFITASLTIDSFAIKVTLNLLSVWNDKNFVKVAPLRQHRHIFNEPHYFFPFDIYSRITEAIQFFISRANRDLLEGTSLLPMLVKGVQTHMQNPQRDIRILGMVRFTSSGYTPFLSTKLGVYILSLHFAENSRNILCGS